MQAVEGRHEGGVQTLAGGHLSAPALVTLLAAFGAVCGLIIATLLSQDPREALAYAVACVMIGGAIAVGRREAPRRVVIAGDDTRQEIRTIVHDLRAPLVTVSSYLDLVAEGAFGPVTPETSAALRQATMVAGRAQSMVEGLLDGGTVTARSTEITRVDLEDVISEVLDALTASMRERHASVSLEGRMPVVRGEQTALFRVFENLLQNSIKFTRRCDAPRISLHTRRLDGGLVEVAVRDNGVGFRRDESQDVLQAGVRGAAAEDGPPGHGLGLATVSRLVASMGGTVAIDPPCGRGSTVRVTFRPA